MGTRRSSRLKSPQQQQSSQETNDSIEDTAGRKQSASTVEAPKPKRKRSNGRVDQKEEKSTAKKSRSSSSTSTLSRIPFAAAASSQEDTLSSAGTSKATNASRSTITVDVGRRRHSEPVKQIMPPSSSSSSSANWSQIPINKVLDASFLKRHINKKDLSKRFRHLLKTIQTECLQEEEDENAPMENTGEKWPGLGGLAWYLVQAPLNDKDATVRLLAAATCLELLAVFAPDIPWDTPGLKAVWTEVLHQIATLTSNCDKNEANLQFLTRMLQQLADVQMGALLVELANDEKEEDITSSSSSSHNAPDEPNNKIISSSESESDSSPPEEKIDPPLPTKTPMSSLSALTTAVTANELLSQFVSTLLQAIRAGEFLQDYIVQAISAILSEYVEEQEQHVPVAVLDELMLGLLPGPTVRVPKYSTTQHGVPPVWHSVENPVYRVSALVLQTHATTLQKPLSSLLHQLLAKAYHGSGQHDILLESNIATEPHAKTDETAPATQHDLSVYSVLPLVYHISAASSSSTTFGATNHTLLETRVLGTLQEGLTHLNADTRQATCLMVAQCLTGSRHLDSLLLKPWLARHKDAVPSIRKLVAQHVPSLLYEQSQAQQSSEEETQRKLMDAIETLLGDPQKNVRVAAMHSAFNDYLYPHAADGVTHSSVREIVNRLIRVLLDLELSVAEQNDILSALARVWARAAWRPLESVLSSNDGGDESSEDRDLFSSLVMQQLQLKESFSSLTSPSNRRKIQDHNKEPWFVDWLIPRLFQIACSASQHNAPNPHHRQRAATQQKCGPNQVRLFESVLEQAWQKYARHKSTQRAATLVLWHRVPFQTGISWGQPRARRQDALRDYLEARTRAQEAPKGTEEALVADAKAMEVLRRLSWWMSWSTDNLDDDEDHDKVLTAFHKCRDKQIFRILSSIATPTHSHAARQRALEQVPSRCKAFTNGEAVAEFALDLVHQTAMPDFMNYLVLKEVIQMAEHYPQLRSTALEIVHMTTHSFAKMAEPAWKPLATLLQKMYNDSSENESEQGDGEDRSLCDEHQTNLITAILATAAPMTSAMIEPPSCLIDLCKEGTPDQARNAVKALVGLDTAGHEQEESNETLDDSPYNARSLMGTLSSVLSPTKTRRTRTILASLTALVESAPKSATLVESASHDAWRFCLTAMNKDVERSPVSPKRKRSRSPVSPKRKRSRSPDAHKSNTDTLVCASFEFLVSFVRSYLLGCSGQNRKSFLSARQSDLQNIFSRLVAVMQSTKASDKVRECAVINFCRLCDSRLQLETNFVTCGGWHTFSRVFLEESSVQEALVQEFRYFLTGGGVYGDEGSPLPPGAPSLRICSAFIFAQTKNMKSAATECIKILRETCEKTFSQCMALGKRAEERYESMYKMRLMPEYMVPYAFHLLAATTEEGDDKTLRKRLRFLYEPLVRSLGDDADNVSFLLRMAEHLSSYKAILPGNEDSESMMQFISKVAREVLLSLVKTDVNLSPYAGQIQIPRKLFDLMPPKHQDKPDGNSAPKSSLRKRQSETPVDRRKSRVQFSPVPDILHLPSQEVRPPSRDRDENSSFGGLSPIAKSASPQSSTESYVSPVIESPYQERHIEPGIVSEARTPASDLGSSMDNDTTAERPSSQESSLQTEMGVEAHNQTPADGDKKKPTKKGEPREVAGRIKVDRSETTKTDKTERGMGTEPDHESENRANDERPRKRQTRNRALPGSVARKGDDARNLRSRRKH